MSGGDVGLGEMLIEERRRRGWTQHDLARRLGVASQQAISRWESGTSSPQRSVLPRLGRLLGLPVAVLVEACGYSAPGAPPTATPPPVDPLVPILPLEHLPPDRFEGFCRDFLHLLRGGEVHRHGGQGHRQRGVDLLVTRPDGSREAYQCKRHKEFGPAKVRAAIDAVGLPADRYVLVLARPHASPQAREELAKHPAWSLWDGEDISNLIRHELDREAAVRLVDVYFPRWREAFLGVPEPGPWLTAEEYFRPLSGSGVFTHGRSLIGRKEPLEAITAWLADPSAAPIGLLLGRGGIGKTRLLREVAERAESEQGMKARMLDAHSPVTRSDFGLLPGGNVLLLVDDAHDRDDLAVLIHGLASRPGLKGILALRPYGQPAVASALRSAGGRSGDLPQWELDDLQVEETERLAALILRQQGTAPVRRLAVLTKDCPLLTVLGAELVSRGKLSAAMFDGAADIRREILQTFRDVLADDDSGSGGTLRRDVLNVVSALQPLRADDSAPRSTVVEVVGRPWDQVEREFRHLEAAGVVLRRRASLRIVPDLLGDAVLTEACFDPSGLSTGFLERVFAAAQGAAKEHLFVNASRIDWRIRQERAVDGTVLEMLWKKVAEEFRRAGIHGRADLTRVVARAAPFAPGPALKLARWAASNPTRQIEDHRNLLASLLRDVTYAEVLHEIPSVLRGVAYSIDHVSEAADLLWQLAVDDNRRPNQYPDHPLRVLRDLAEYQPTKRLDYNEQIVRRAAEWLKNGPRSDLHSPFDVLEPLLATEGSETVASERAVTFRPFVLKPEPIQRTRDKVVELALQELTGEDISRAVRAAKALQAALVYPSGKFGKDVSEAERNQWTRPFLDTIDALREAATTHRLDPLVWLQIKEAVSWHARWSPTETKSAAQRLLQNCPTSLKYRLGLAVVDSWGGWIHDITDDFAAAQSQFEGFLDAIADELLAARTPADTVDFVEERLAAIAEAFDQHVGDVGRLTRKVVEREAAVATIVCERACANPSTHAVRMLAPAIAALAEQQPDEAVRWAEELLRADSPKLARHVARAFGWGRGGRPLADGELEFLGRLGASSDPRVRQAVIGAVQTIHASSPTDAVELLLSVPFHDSEPVAEEVFACFSRRGFLTWEALQPQQVQRLLDQLVTCPTLGGYQSHTALAHLSASHPHAVSNLLMRRVERVEDGAAEFDAALPYEWHQPLRFREHRDFPAILRRVRDWMASPDESGWREELGPDVFKAVAGGVFDHEVLRLLQESIDTGHRALLQTVGAILREAPRELVLNSPDFVAAVLEAAAQVDQDCLQLVGGSLHAAASSGGRSGIAGMPFNEDVQQRDRSAEIAAAFPPGSPTRRFYESLHHSAVEIIEWATDSSPLDARQW